MFRINQLSLNFDKIYYLKFMTKNHKINAKIFYEEKQIINTPVPNFLHYSLTVHYRGINTLLN